MYDEIEIRPPRALLAVSRACAYPTRPIATSIQPITRDGAILHIDPPRCATHHHERTTWRHAAVRDTPPSSTSCVPERMTLLRLLAASRACYTPQTTHSNLNPARYARRRDSMHGRFTRSASTAASARGRGKRAKREGWSTNMSMLVLIVCPFTPLHDGNHLGSREGV